MIGLVFIIASIIVTVFGLYFYTDMLKKISNHPEDFQQLFPQFMIKLAMSEFIPVALIVYGIINLPKGVDPEALVTPFVILLAIVVLNVFLVFSRTNMYIPKEEQPDPLKTIKFISIMILNTIPFISIIMLLTTVA